jgi:hypothetical protein
MLAGRMSPEDVAKKTQADWQDYQSELNGG